MRRMMRNVARLCGIDMERGVTAIEYALIASLIALAIIVGATLLGINLNALFSCIAGVVVVTAAEMIKVRKIALCRVAWRDGESV